jgi:SAM-dependent methyltransferase
MCKNWIESVDQGFYNKHGRYLDDLQREILLRCYNSKQKYEQIATELNFDVGHITGRAAELWKLLSDVFGEEVRKANLRSSVKRYLNRLDQTPLKPFNIFISDRSSNSEPSKNEQLRGILQERRQETIIAEDWLQRSNEELNECICFLLIVSSHSVNEIDIITKELQKARELRETRQNRTLAILLIHVDSCLSLPLNHPLIQELQQGTTQLEWDFSTEISTFVEEIMQCLETENRRETLNEWELLIKKLRKLQISDNWMLTYVGENQLLKLNEFVNALKNDTRRIQSCYSYWGVSPTQMWTIACNDPAYHMRKNLEEFPRYAKQLAHHVDKEHYNFVSLGVGEGSKDSSIVKDFFNRDESYIPRDDFLYLPVDMSLDMLRVAIGKIQELPSHRRIAIQRDIETKEGMEEIAHIANVLGKNKPILYGFIGNTIANVEDPEQVLSNIVRVMKPEDRLLFEAQIIDDFTLKNSEDRLQETIKSVVEEYEGISFRRFALSALLQNSDLSIEPREKDLCYLVEASLQDWKYGQLLQIDCCFKNNTDREIFLTFPTGDTTTLNLEEKINLYSSRKFAQTTLENFVQATNLRILGKKPHLSDKGTGFMVMMLRREN